MSLHHFASLVENALRKPGPAKRRKVDRNRYFMEVLDPIRFTDQGLLAYFLPYGVSSLWSWVTPEVVQGLTVTVGDLSAGDGVNWSAHWAGQLQLPADGSVMTLRLVTSGSASVSINGQTVVSAAATPAGGSAGDVDGDGQLGFVEAYIMGDLIKGGGTFVSNLDPMAYNQFGFNLNLGALDLDGNGIIDGTDAGMLDTEMYGSASAEGSVTINLSDILGSGFAHGSLVDFEADLTTIDGHGDISLDWGGDWTDDGFGGGPGSGVAATNFFTPKPHATLPAVVNGTEGSPVQITAPFSDLAQQGFTRSVNWGDPNTPSADTNVSINYTDYYRFGTLSASHTYAHSGTYTAALALAGPTGISSKSFTVTVVPAAPSNLVATADWSDQIHLAWADHSASEDGFNIYLSTDGGASYGLYGQASANATSYVTSALPPEVGYLFKVSAYHGPRESARSTAASLIMPSVTIPGGGPSVGQSSGDLTSLDVGWQATPGATDYMIDWSSDGGQNFRPLASVPGDQLGYTAAGLARGTTYNFRVTANTRYGSGSAQTVSLTTAPRTPTGITASLDGTQVKLTWTDVAGETGYEVQWRNDGSTWQSLAGPIAAGVTTLNDSSASMTQKTYYQIRSFNDTGSSDFSPAVTFAPVPAAPGLGSVLADYGTNTISVNWADNSSNETGFYVYQSEDGIHFAQVADRPAGSTTYQAPFTTVGDGGKNYTFKVVAHNAAGDSAPSRTNGVFISPPSVSNTSALRLDARVHFGDESGVFVLAWYDQSSAVSYTHVYLQAAADAGSFITIHDFGASGSSAFSVNPNGFGSIFFPSGHTVLEAAYTDGLVNGISSYSYRLLGVDASGNMYYSPAACTSSFVPGGSKDINPTTTSPPPGHTVISIEPTRTTGRAYPPTPEVVTVRRQGDTTYAMSVAVQITSRKYATFYMAAGASYATYAFYPNPEYYATAVFPTSFTLAGGIYQDAANTSADVDPASQTWPATFSFDPPVADPSYLDADTFRTDGRFGEEAPTTDNADPSRYLVPTNNNFDMDGQTPDYMQLTVLTPTAAGTANPDKDLAKIVLWAPSLASGVPNGTLRVTLSNQNGARLFKDDGTPLTDFSVDLTNPGNNDLADLAAGVDVPLWVEGLTADSDLIIKYAYTNNATGYETARATIHMAIVDMSLVSPSGTGSAIVSPASVSASDVRGYASGRPFAGGAFDAFMPRVIGLPALLMATVVAQDAANPSHSVNSPFSTGSPITDGRRLALARTDSTWTTGDGLLASSVLGLDVFQTDELLFTLTTSPGGSLADGDVLRRSVKSVTADIGFNTSNSAASDPDNTLHDGTPDVGFVIDDADEQAENAGTAFNFWWNHGSSSQSEVIAPSDLTDLTPFRIYLPSDIVSQAHAASPAYTVMLRLNYAGSNPLAAYIYPNPAASGSRLDFLSDQAKATALVNWSASAPAQYHALDLDNSEIPLDTIRYLQAGSTEFLVRFDGSGSAKALLSLVLKYSNGSEQVLDRSVVRVQEPEQFYSLASARGTPTNPQTELTSPFLYNSEGGRSEWVNTYTWQMVRDRHDPSTNKTMVFLHGFNVPYEGAEATFSNVYKRLYWQGFRGNFVGFAWLGDAGNATSFDPNNVNAIHTSPALWRFLRNGIEGSKSVGGWGVSPENVDIAAHSLGNLVMWDAIRLNGTYTTQKVIHSVTSIEAAVWTEAFAPAGTVTYSGDFPISYSPTELEQNSWHHWFNPTAYNIRDSIAGNVINSYYTSDLILQEAMRANDVLWRHTHYGRSTITGFRTASNLVDRPALMLPNSRKPSYTSDDISLAQGLVPNPIADRNVDASTDGWTVDGVGSLGHSSYQTQAYPTIFAWWRNVFAGGGDLSKAGAAIGVQ